MADDDLLDSHPDLADPEWRRNAEQQARRAARKNRPKRPRRPRRRIGGWWRLAAVVVVLGAAVAGIVAVGGSPEPQQAVPHMPEHAHIDLAHPYADTPADSWRKGVDGITSPAAAAMGNYQPDAVADAYAQVRRAIVASKLDPTVLFGHDPKGYLALFAPDERTQLAGVLSAKPAPGRPDFMGYLTEIQDGYHLLDAGPRTYGTLSAHPGEKPGELTVDANYIVAYAFDNVHPETLDNPSEIVSFARVKETYVVRSGRGFADASHGLWVDDASVALSSVGCAAAKEGFLAPGYATPYRERSPERLDAPGYYDLKYPMPNLNGCVHA